MNACYTAFDAYSAVRPLMQLQMCRLLEQVGARGVALRQHLLWHTHNAEPVVGFEGVHVLCVPRASEVYVIVEGIPCVLWTLSDRESMV
jgi:uncharacterized protein YbaR (Trm112 family)